MKKHVMFCSFPFNKKSIHLTIKHGMDKGDQIPIHIAAKVLKSKY